MKTTPKPRPKPPKTQTSIFRVNPHAAMRIHALAQATGMQASAVTSQIIAQHQSILDDSLTPAQANDVWHAQTALEAAKRTATARIAQAHKRLRATQPAPTHTRPKKSHGRKTHPPTA